MFKLRPFGLKYFLFEYEFEEDYLLVKEGFPFTRKISSINYIQVKDIEINRTFYNLITNTYTIKLYSSDETTPEYNLINLKNGDILSQKLREHILHKKEKLSKVERI